jgi:chromosome segregation ATPase
MKLKRTRKFDSSSSNSSTKVRIGRRSSISTKSNRNFKKDIPPLVSNVEAYEIYNKELKKERDNWKLYADNLDKELDEWKSYTKNAEKEVNELKLYIKKIKKELDKMKLYIEENCHVRITSLPLGYEQMINHSSIPISYGRTSNSIPKIRYPVRTLGVQ